MEKLSGGTYRQLLRISRGERVEPNYGSFGGKRIAHELSEHKLVTIEATPKGRKRWYVLTEKGKAYLPAAQKYIDAQTEGYKAAKIEHGREERIYHAGRQCYEYVKALADAGDADAIWFLTKLGLWEKVDAPS